MLNALSNSLVLLAIIALGYFLKQRGVLGPQYRHLFLTLLLNVTIPCAIIANFDMRLDLAELIVPLLISCGACALLNLAAIVLTRGQPGTVRALTLLMTCGFMVAPFSIPFVQASMSDALMAMAAFDVAQSFFNMGTNFTLASALAHGGGAAARFSPKALLGNMLRSAPLVTYAALLLLRALRWELPAIALNFCGKVGGANAFLGMLFIGMVLDLRLERAALRQLARILAIRYGMALGIGLICFFVLPIPRLVARAVTLGLLAPVSNASMAYCDALGCDAKLYGAAGSVSFVVGIVGYAGLLMV